MKFFVVFAVALACVAADVSHVVSNDYTAPIVRSDFDITPEGFQYAYETGNGIAAQSSGQVKNVNSEYPSLAVQGSFKYTAPGGEVVEQSYVADEEGFKPVGSHIPVSPPIPEAIARSLAYIAAHPPPAEPQYKSAPVQNNKPVFG